MEGSALVAEQNPCLLLQQEVSPHARPPAAPRVSGRSQAAGPACHHLHSTATVFCAGEAEDGLMPVSEDPDDVDTVVLDTEGADWFRLVSRNRSEPVR